MSAITSKYTIVNEQITKNHQSFFVTLLNKNIRVLPILANNECFNIQGTTRNIANNYIRMFGNFQQFSHKILQ